MHPFTTSAEIKICIWLKFEKHFQKRSSPGFFHVALIYSERFIALSEDKL